MPGGLGQAKPADEEIQKLVDSVSDEIKSQSGGKDFAHLKAISYRSQVVAGTNFYVKVHTGDDHLHVKIFRPLPVHGDKAQVTGLQHGKSHEDEISFF